MKEILTKNEHVSLSRGGTRATNRLGRAGMLPLARTGRSLTR